MHGPATRRPPFFMHEDNATLQCLGACFADTAAPRSLPDDRRLVFFAIPVGYLQTWAQRQFLTRRCSVGYPWGMPRKRKRRRAVLGTAILTFEDLVRQRFRRQEQKGATRSWFPVTCRTAAKFLKAQGLSVRVPRPGYEVEVKKDRGTTTILTNYAGRCEFAFRY